jgi:hypothetical protein
MILCDFDLAAEVQNHFSEISLAFGWVCGLTHIVT